MESDWLPVLVLESDWSLAWVESDWLDDGMGESG